VPPPVVDPGETAVPADSASAGLIADAGQAQGSGDWQRAEALLQRAQRIDSRNARVYLALSRLYRAQGETSQSRSMAERGLLYCEGATCRDLRSELE
jgi:Tfp pilus assembly protein PilF